MLLWHEQNLVVIILLWGVNKSKNNKPIQSVIVSKTETNLHYHAHKSSGPWYDFGRACRYVTSNNLSIILQIIYDGLPMAPDTLVYPELHNRILGRLSECHYMSDKISVFRIHDNIISTSCMKWHIIVKSNWPLLGKIIAWTFFWDEMKLNAEFKTNFLPRVVNLVKMWWVLPETMNNMDATAPKTRFLVKKNSYNSTWRNLGSINDICVMRPRWVNMVLYRTINIHVIWFAPI